MQDQLVFVFDVEQLVIICFRCRCCCCQKQNRLLVFAYVVVVVFDVELLVGTSFYER